MEIWGIFNTLQIHVSVSENGHILTAQTKERRCCALEITV